MSSDPMEDFFRELDQACSGTVEVHVPDVDVSMPLDDALDMFGDDVDRMIAVCEEFQAGLATPSETMEVVAAICALLNIDNRRYDSRMRKGLCRL